MKPTPAILLKREIQARFFELYKGGMTVDAALAEVGRDHSTYEYWRKSDPDFRRKVDTLRLAKRDPSLQNIDFIEFRKVFFGFDSYWHHMKMIEAIEGAAPQSITMILAPPEHGKTSLMEDFICWKLAVNPDFRIAVISESQEHARKIVGRVQDRMTDPEIAPFYLETFGPFKADDREFRKPWNADYMTLVKSHSGERDYNLEARGIGSRIYGARYDLVILDDVQSDVNLNATEKILTRFRQTIITRPGTNGKIIIVGTRVGPGDFYEVAAEEEGLIDKVVKLPALNMEGEALCPEMWPIEALQKRRVKVGEETWARVYMQRSGDGARQTFTEEMIQGCLDRERTTSDRAPGLEQLMAVDPAIGGVCATTAASYSQDKLWILDLETIEGLARNEQLFEQVASFANRWRPATCIFEVDGLGKGLHDSDQLRRLSEKFGFDVIPHVTRRNKADPSWGVAGMASAFTNKEISIPYGDEASRRAMNPLLDELRRWRPGVSGNHLKQDCVMTLWFLWRFWVIERRYINIEAPVEWRPSWVA